MKLWFNLLCRDIDAQFAFYRQVLDLPEAAKSRSPIYRALEAPTFQFGFNGAAAYALLGIEDRKPEAGGSAPTIAYATFMVDATEAVGVAAATAADMGGKLIKGPFSTYYGQWQVVLEDPEGNVFRMACETLPEGVRAAMLPFADSPET
ncbi:VOC family protein [Cupriavidus pauculus]|uniref:Bleomycin resistance protein n=1 Tax=Cupriavidus pauculus TaxID=82633 RepID=A0A2N5CF57_9BURK|nr:VOC family protein [Cupriavidus pauculus]PLQ00870.1 bleomycin resistance protein [Cupriavidus pauculus]